jgi:hypothetical protein
VKGDNHVFVECRYGTTTRDILLLPGGGVRHRVIGTASFLHGIKRDDYTDRRYVD